MMEQAKCAIVTGAAGNIGEACCRRLLDAAAGDRLDKELDGGDAFRFWSADVSSESDVEAYVHEVVEQFGGIDAFFNNAGVEGAVSPIPTYPVETFDKLISVNLRGVFLGLKHVMS